MFSDCHKPQPSLGFIEKYPDQKNEQEREQRGRIEADTSACIADDFRQFVWHRQGLRSSVKENTGKEECEAGTDHIQRHA